MTKVLAVIELYSEILSIKCNSFLRWLISIKICLDNPTQIKPLFDKLIDRYRNCLEVTYVANLPDCEQFLKYLRSMGNIQNSARRTYLLNFKNTGIYKNLQPEIER
ncbi:hypothetical protein RF11_04990 [Thelohanellus kitauei]|uniref:Uncharacterized protein n=1 Tax=Thelohanellus kitauei TaxID=669202 RepID=A0A0C2JNL5_THEKT|nr:hypothetical protein RF11_04990 [Thelohanellus kitauei]